MKGAVSVATGVGFSLLLRVGELVALNRGHVAFHTGPTSYAKVTIAKSKTDQSSKGMSLFLACTCKNSSKLSRAECPFHVL